METHIGNSTVFSPVAMLVVIVGGMLGIIVPRRFAAPVLLSVALLVPMANRIEIFGLGFMVHRVVVLFGWARVLLRGEVRGFSRNSIDTTVVCLAVWGTIAYTLLWGTGAALINRLGVAFDVLGLYFLFRVMIQDWDDFSNTITGFAFICTVLAVSMTIEFVTTKNPFSLLGSVDEDVWTRLGTMRCRGSFAHALSAGIFGASLVPLYLVCMRRDSPISRTVALVGLGASSVVAVTSASSSSVMTYAAGLGALFLWRYRSRLRSIRWGVAFTLLGLHLTMKAPVWALLARMNIFGGSTGYHRYWLFDEFVKRFNEWWLIGVKDTGDWDPLLWDVVNQYVLEGVRGGLLGLILFVILLSLLFRQVGRTVKRLDEQDPRVLVVWALGAMLFAHCAAFWAYDYWDQIKVLWYFLLAVIASLPTIIETQQLSENVESVEEEADVESVPSAA